MEKLLKDFRPPSMFESFGGWWGIVGLLAILFIIYKSTMPGLLG